MTLLSPYEYPTFISPSRTPAFIGPSRAPTFINPSRGPSYPCQQTGGPSYLYQQTTRSSFPPSSQVPSSFMQHGDLTFHLPYMYHHPSCSLGDPTPHIPHMYLYHPSCSLWCPAPHIPHRYPYHSDIYLRVRMIMSSRMGTIMRYMLRREIMKRRIEIMRWFISLIKDIIFGPTEIRKL